ncbi:hypothetical protein [Brachybacterium alimentarium]|uniref:hypothetical protein n=1 Tax=Brachybacterium alimentarium TaxID=47845 RepID=UPI000DF18336|nr:hypothetical protein [Brachybacterium alimentarium]RCS81331.1 hypothetical protein CIK67_16285 [Brachybacterium alimentarium]
MAYEAKTDWKDLPDKSTPVTAAELVRIETGIEEAHDLAEDAAPASHKHAADDIDSGTLAAARIPTLAQSKVTGLSAALDEKASAADLAALVARVETLETAEG